MQLGVFMLATLALAMGVDGHGRLTDPPSRSSMWRYGFNTPMNVNDNFLSCGGFTRQWFVNHGKCGVCGDPWDGPRDNEAGGRYATGIITKSYTEGQIITAVVEITTNDRGWFEFRICPNNDPSKPATEDCLNRHLLAQPSGSTRIQLPGTFRNRKHNISLVLPAGVTCTQCVFQWKWNAGNNYGCDGGHCGLGVGPQEQMYGCADIAITAASGHLPVTASTGSSSGQSKLSDGFIPIGLDQHNPR